ncbi:MAG: hypothetical protein KME43_23360 [Myxacorys chilensis ATA2-1-KO14]|nr:hypothetical protein [Myxacorys chilensis ATA2-1-KO14]
MPSVYLLTITKDSGYESTNFRTFRSKAGCVAVECAWFFNAPHLTLHVFSANALTGYRGNRTRNGNQDKQRSEAGWISMALFEVVAPQFQVFEERLNGESIRVG